ncbi:phage tail tube protein [Paenibacillus sp. 1001270B_150601_E10]|uniref:phage tail tube protein n=1 Tax=Paenibacillus sp. 1001270B_150601_E10 TaxID=2787079 RepID=UPI00189CE7B5|nr:phage tail tube protein [Paenibacillus sp. 1001270B_150601_E10]
MAYLKARDTISGQEGRAYLQINGQQEEMFYIKTLEASIEKSKAEVKTLGKRGTQHKSTGWSGTGSMTIYYVTTKFRKLMMDYIKDGVDTYFDIMVVNEDPSSTIGRQSVVLHGVNLDSVIMAKLDTESEAMEEETNFTFEDISILEDFVNPVLGG